MSLEHKITDLAAMRSFLTAGCATFTLVSCKTGTRYTYKVEAPTKPTPKGGLKREIDEPVRFVRLLTGQNNERDYTYLGTLRADGGYWEGAAYAHGVKSKVTPEAPSAVGFAWFSEALRRNDADKLARVEFWHEGRCGRCGRKLTDPASIERGLGPECAGL